MLGKIKVTACGCCLKRLTRFSSGCRCFEPSTVHHFGSRKEYSLWVAKCFRERGAIQD